MDEIETTPEVVEQPVEETVVAPTEEIIVEDETTEENIVA